MSKKNRKNIETVWKRREMAKIRRKEEWKEERGDTEKKNRKKTGRRKERHD